MAGLSWIYTTIIIIVGNSMSNITNEAMEIARKYQEKPEEVILILLIRIDFIYPNLAAVGSVEDCMRRQSAQPIVASVAGAPLNSNIYWSLKE